MTTEETDSVGPKRKSLPMKEPSKESEAELTLMRALASTHKSTEEQINEKKKSSSKKKKKKTGRGGGN